LSHIFSSTNDVSDSLAKRCTHLAENHALIREQEVHQVAEEAQVENDPTIQRDSATRTNCSCPSPDKEEIPILSTSDELSLFASWRTVNQNLVEGENVIIGRDEMEELTRKSSRMILRLLAAKLKFLGVK